MAEIDDSQGDTAPTPPADDSIAMSNGLPSSAAVEAWVVAEGSASEIPTVAIAAPLAEIGIVEETASRASIAQLATLPDAESASSAPIPARPLSGQSLASQPPILEPILGQFDLPEHIVAKGAQSDSSENTEEESDAVDVAARTAPPWLLSTVVHMLILIILGLWDGGQHINETAVIELAVYDDNLGDQLLDASIEISGPKLEPQLESPALSLTDVPEVAEPLAFPTQPTFMAQGNAAARDLPAPAIGYALAGRDAGRKQVLLGKYGGDKTTEESVVRALAWLKRNQRPNGSWSMVGPYSDKALSENTVAATAMALLAFQGAGHTHKEGDYQTVVERGIAHLLKMQNGEGLFSDAVVPNTQLLYSHGQATIVICEAYGMTKDSRLLPSAERAVRYCIESQSPAGGWRYAPKADADTSVTGWMLMGLQSAKMAGIDVPQATFDNISRFLDSVASESGSRYRYQELESAPRGPAMTAEALLCRQYLGWDRSDERLLRGVAHLIDNPIGSGEPDVYYWYYATQVCHHMEGASWTAWNNVMRRTLPASQIKSGAENGSWNPGQDKWGSHQGRLYQTCLSTYMLEVYYRHLPLYTKVFERQ